MKTGFLITARLKSTRLPGKIMRPICGRAVLAHLLDRLKLARRVDTIVVCTSTNPEDDPLVEFASREGVACFRGDDTDVVKRLADASQALRLDYITNITADCPLVDPGYVDRIVEAFLRTGADLIRAMGLPHGAYAYGIKPSAFRRVLEIKDCVDSEVWGRYFTDTDLFTVYDLPVTNPRHRQPQLRMTLDYPEDLAFLEAVFAQLYRPGQVFTLEELLDFLEAHPEVVALNRDCAARYRRRWLAQSEVQLKPRHAVRRALVIGCGSAGQRHIRNLRRLGVTEIVALRSRQGQRQALDPALEVQELEEWDAVWAAHPDIAIVSNPTSLHLETATRCLPHVRGVFIEKPLASSLEGVQPFLEAVAAHRVVTCVGYNLPFHTAIRTVQEWLERNGVGPRLVFQCQAGQWLPDWHPGEDYRKAYFARRDLGGGVTLTLSHEIHLAEQLLGPARAVTGLVRGSPALPLEVETVTDLMVHHASGAVSQIHVDYLQRPPHRRGVISCERGWVGYDLGRLKVEAQLEHEPAAQVAWEDPAYDPNHSYLEELATFLRYVREGRVRHRWDAWQAVSPVAVAEAVFESVRSRRLVELPEWVVNGRD